MDESQATMTPPGRSLIEDALKAGVSVLDEEAGKRFFAAYGIPVPEGATVTSADEAVSMAAKIGYPVVMKGSSPTIQHKTDAGLVLLGIMDDTEVRESFRTLETRAAAAGAKLDGVLVEHMVRGKRLRGDTLCGRGRRRTARSDQGEGSSWPVPRVAGCGP